MNKIYCNYASEEHLLTILLPYINEKLKESQNVVTILEKNIGKSLGSLKKIFNFTKEEWKNIEKVFYLKNESNLFQGENNIVIIVGSTKFIEMEEMNLLKNKEIKVIISCYNIDQIKDNQNIFSKYTQILCTRGIKNINKIFTENSNKIYKKITILK